MGYNDIIVISIRSLSAPILSTEALSAPTHTFSVLGLGATRFRVDGIGRNLLCVASGLERLGEHRRAQ